MTWGFVAAAAISTVGAVVSADKAKDAAEAQAEAAKKGVTQQERARLSSEERQDPFRIVGLNAANQLEAFNAQRDQGLEEINPVVDFLRNQGFEQIQESAAAGGRLGAGGTLKDLTQFNTDLASTIVPQLQNQRFNQLFNTAQLGANVATGQGTQSLQSASNIGNLLGNVGQAQAQGSINQSNAITGGLQNISSAAGAFPNLFSSGQQSPPPSRAGGPAPVVDISTFGQ